MKVCGLFLALVATPAAAVEIQCAPAVAAIGRMAELAESLGGRLVVLSTEQSAAFLSAVREKAPEVVGTDVLTIEAGSVSAFAILDVPSRSLCGVSGLGPDLIEAAKLRAAGIRV